VQRNFNVENNIKFLKKNITLELTTQNKTKSTSRVIYINISFLLDFLLARYRLIVGSDFDFNFWNRLDLTILTLGIDSKSNSISIILELNRLDSTRFSIPILGIELSCQEIENYVIMLRISIFGFKF